MSLHRSMSYYHCPTVSKVFHEPPPYRPHTRSLAVDVHWNCKQVECQLDSANTQEYSARPIFLEPIHDEQGENESVEDI